MMTAEYTEGSVSEFGVGIVKGDVIDAPDVRVGVRVEVSCWG